MLTAHRFAVAVVFSGLAVVTTSAAAAWADPGPGGGSGGDGISVTPSPGLPGVGIGVSDPGSGSSSEVGRRPGHGKSGNGGGTTTDGCVFEAAGPPPAADSPVAVEASKYGGTVVYQICPGGSGGFVWVPKATAKPPPPSAVELARDAYGQLGLPAPVPGRYPAGMLGDGRPDTIVNTHMWFSTDASVWRPVSKTVCAGALCATARAVPTSLSLDPGDGGQVVSCPGPGTVWVRPAGGSWVPQPQPQGCDYQYTKSTYGMPHGELTAAYTITWTVTWTGTNGMSGTLDALTTTARSTFAVAELQTVVIR